MRLIEPMDLKLVMIIYNFCLVVLNIYIATEVDYTYNCMV